MLYKKQMYHGFVKGRGDIVQLIERICVQCTCDLLNSEPTAACCFSNMLFL